MNLITTTLITAVLSLPFIPSTTHIVVEPQETPKVLTTGQITSNKDLLETVSTLAEKYNQDKDLALAIIKCEGQAYKSIGNNKNYKNGQVWSTDIGWWQINDYYHEKSAQKLGLDIYNEIDNLEYGFVLLKEQGTQPWSASKDCWSKIVASR